jgi:hypothetical protein
MEKPTHLIFLTSPGCRRYFGFPLGTPPTAPAFALVLVPLPGADPGLFLPGVEEAVDRSLKGVIECVMLKCVIGCDRV